MLGFGFRVSGSGFKVLGSGLRVPSSGFGFWVAEGNLKRLEVRVSGFPEGVGFRGSLSVSRVRVSRSLEGVRT